MSFVKWNHKIDEPQHYVTLMYHVSHNQTKQMDPIWLPIMATISPIMLQSRMHFFPSLIPRPPLSFMTNEVQLKTCMMLISVRAPNDQHRRYINPSTAVKPSTIYCQLPEWMDYSCFICCAIRSFPPTDYLWLSTAFRECINHLAFTNTLIVFLGNGGPVRSRNKIQSFETLHLFFLLMSVSPFFLFIVHLCHFLWFTSHLSKSNKSYIVDWWLREQRLSFLMSSLWRQVAAAIPLIQDNTSFEVFCSLLQLKMIADVMKGMHSIKLHPLL